MKCYLSYYITPKVYIIMVRVFKSLKPNLFPKTIFCFVLALTYYVFLIDY